MADLKAVASTKKNGPVSLLQKIKAHASDKTWEKIMTLLGMANENDQLSGLPNRQIAIVAQQHAEHNPKHWALKFDEAIDENLIKTRVTVGRDKAPLYVLAVETQAAARAYAARDKLMIQISSPPALATHHALRSIVIEPGTGK